MVEVIIRRERDGREYAIQSYDFRRGKHYQQPDGTWVTFEEAGFRIVSLADGQPYEQPRAHGESSP